VLGEVRLGRRLRAVRVSAEVDLVEVGLEDPVLAPGLDLRRRQAARNDPPHGRQALLLELDGEAGLLRLPLPRDLAPDVEVADELLRERRASLDDLALLHVLDGGADDPLVVDAVVRVETPVLDRDRGLGEQRRHLVERDRLAVLLRRNRAEQRAVRGVHERVLPDGDGLQRGQRAAVQEGLRTRERRGGEDAAGREEERDDGDDHEAPRLHLVAMPAVPAAAALAIGDRPPAAAVAVPVPAVALAVAAVSAHP